MPQHTTPKDSPSHRDSKPTPSTRSDAVDKRANFIDPFSDPTLSSYLANVRDWHGYIRFLGLPHLRENPDVLIDKLYVEPFLSKSYASPDTSPEKWPEVETVQQTLATQPHLILLGDPGSGKSTLVSWLACQFAQPTKSEWIEQFGQLVPVPMVLRELKIGKETTWEGLVRAFLNHDMAKPLRDGSKLQDLLQRGQALIMLDGLDEIGDVGARENLREAIHRGIIEHFSCLWLMTSRIVGYETVPFHYSPGKRGQTPPNKERERFRPSKATLRRPFFGTRSLLEDWYYAHRVASIPIMRYVSPFTDDQIARFARNWFTQREAVRETAERQAFNFIGAVREEPSTARLARVPNLLTMMALIHRVRARLPHGRALLYNEISQAYLQSIDEHRGLLKEEYPYAQKRRWLARVGFEMQRRRSAVRENAHETTRDILVSERDVVSWIATAMQESDSRLNEQAAAEFVDWIGRRSGLLLPRGPGQFAFMHLSFQEYFAACFLVEQVMSPSYIRSGKAAPGAGREDLRNYARDALWRETLVFLFELAADQPEWPKTLAEDLFGEGFADLNTQGDIARQGAVLLARLAIDPHSGLTTELRSKAIFKCSSIEIAMQQQPESYNSYMLDVPEIARELFGAEPDQLPVVWESFVRAAREIKATTLNLTGCRGANSIEPFLGLDLEQLYLSDTSVTDISGLEKFQSLTMLDISDTEISDLNL